jgi:hypothetical protein
LKVTQTPSRYSNVASSLLVQIIRFNCSLKTSTFLDQNPYWEANFFSPSRDIPRILWNTKVHCRFPKRWPLVRIYHNPHSSSLCLHILLFTTTTTTTSYYYYYYYYYYYRRRRSHHHYCRHHHYHGHWYLLYAGYLHLYS